MKYRTLGGLLALIALATLATLAALALGPDRDLEFTREVPTQQSPQALSEALRLTAIWPQWFHSTTEAKMYNAAGQAYSIKDSYAQVGARVHLTVDPHKGPWKRFELLTEITAYEPGKLLRLRLIEDSHQRLTRVFDRLEWQVELLPGAVRGTCLAHTAHWKSRLMSHVALKILMHQAFYPDLLKLADLSRPELQSPFYPGQQ